MELLFLTQEERTRLFEGLPAALQDAWKDKLRTETITAYETPEELKTRMLESEFEGLNVSDVPLEALPSFLFTIGASGVEALIALLLQQKDLTDQDMHGIASLSRTRHRLLEMNAVLA
jgi:hypothetical protein